MTRLALAALLFAACGGDDGGGGGTTDGKMADAPSTNKVVTVTCPTTPDREVSVNTAGTGYMPAATTAPVNAIVRFTMTATHDVAPNPQTTSDPGLRVGFGETKCLKFT
ncbi:MAG TPA: hypothetical protein VFV99_07305, partial [Kofleriaceae bacterium]|nr:hypothetical protein [Kofleriaceae bacterium]